MQSIIGILAMATEAIPRTGGNKENDDDCYQRHTQSDTFYPDSPDKKLVIDMPEEQDVEVEKEKPNLNPNGNENMFFGAEGGGFLDILASVAASKLEEERSTEGPCIQNALAPNDIHALQFSYDPVIGLKTESQVDDLDPEQPRLKSAKRERQDAIGDAALQSKRSNPRRLADYEKLGFAQISRMSLNTLLRLFSEPDFDEMRKVYSYKCYFMPDGVCQEKVQSFGNEAKAKAQMKNHLQSHIKETLKRDDYFQFTAEPVAARKKRISQQQSSTNNNPPISTSYQAIQHVWKRSSDAISKVIKNELPYEEDFEPKTQHSVPASTMKLMTPKQEPRTMMAGLKDVDTVDNLFKGNDTNNAMDHVFVDKAAKTETIFHIEPGKENIPESMTENIWIPNLQTSAITYSNQADKVEASSQIVTPLITPVNSHVQDVSTLSSRRAFVIKEGQDGPFKAILSPNCGQIMDIEQAAHIVDVSHEHKVPSNTNETVGTLCDNRTVSTQEDAFGWKNSQASVFEDHCYSLMHKISAAPVLASPVNHFYTDASNSNRVNDVQPVLKQESYDMKQTRAIIIKQDYHDMNAQEKYSQIFTNQSNEQNSNGYDQLRNWQENQLMESESNFESQTSDLEVGMKIISEKALIPGDVDNNLRNSIRAPSIQQASNSVPISPITIAGVPIARTRARIRPASASGHSGRIESRHVSDHMDKEKSEALQAIRDLQAKGATTEDLSCHICQPSKCFTAYTTLLSHLRSHAGIRKFNT